EHRGACLPLLITAGCPACGRGWLPSSPGPRSWPPAQCSGRNDWGRATATSTRSTPANGHSAPNANGRPGRWTNGVTGPSASVRGSTTAGSSAGSTRSTSSTPARGTPWVGGGGPELLASPPRGGGLLLAVLPAAHVTVAADEHALRAAVDAGLQFSVD